MKKRLLEHPETLTPLVAAAAAAAAASASPADEANNSANANAANSTNNADPEAKIAKELENFHKNHQPLVDHYDKQGKMHKVNADQSADAIFDDIKKIIEKETGIIGELLQALEDVSPPLEDEKSKQKVAELS